MDGMQGIGGGQLGALIERAIESRLARRAPASAAPPADKTLPVSRPLGESGAFIQSVNKFNSFLRMFMVETSHLPAQDQRSGGPDRVIAQNITLRVMVLPGGAPMAIGGAAETRARAADGGSQVIREMAYVSSMRQFAMNSVGTANGLGTQPMPLIEQRTDSPLAAWQVLDDRRLILSAGAPPLADLFRAVSPGALGPMADALGQLTGALSRLRAAFARLAQPETFVAASPRSSAPLFLKAEAGLGAAPGVYEVEVARAARGHGVESAETTPGPLGLAGTFYVNGLPVAVSAGDSLVSLAAKINRGEDLNGNGQLDAGEDANGNYRLDGGTAAHGVAAGFFEDRLRLTATDAAAGEISLRDPNNILQTLGVVAFDANGQAVFPHEVNAPQDALIRVNGLEYRSDTNVFDSAIPGVTMTLNGEPGGMVTVTVEPDATAAAGAVRSALEAFNAAMRAMNGALSSAGGLLARDPAATRVRRELAWALLAPVGGQPADLDEAADVGVTRAARWRAVFSQNQLESAARSLSSGLPAIDLARAEAPPSVYNALDELGITAAADDTFQFDAERFSAALLARGGDVAALFTRVGEGLAVRVIDRLSAAVDAGGSLDRRRAALEALLAARTGEKFAGAFQPDPRGALISSLGDTGQ